MKVFVVLAIAVLSGCHANLFYADEPKPQLEQLTDAYWDYVGKAIQTADDTVEMIRKSQLGQDVYDRIIESADVAIQYTVFLWKQLPPADKDLVNKITQEAEELGERLRERLEQDLGSVKGKLEPYAEEIKTQVQQRVEQLKQDLAPYAESLDSEALRTTLIQKIEELWMVVQGLAPYAEDLKDKLDPYAQDLKAQLTALYQAFTKTN